MKYIIAIVVVVVGNAIILSISYNLGALLTAILSGGLVVWGFNYVGLFGKKKDAKWIKDKIKFKKTKKVEVVEEEEEKEWGFFTYVIVWGVIAYLIYLFFDINLFAILMFMIKGTIEGLGY